MRHGGWLIKENGERVPAVYDHDRKEWRELDGPPVIPAPGFNIASSEADDEGD